MKCFEIFWYSIFVWYVDNCSKKNQIRFLYNTISQKILYDKYIDSQNKGFILVTFK